MTTIVELFTHAVEQHGTRTALLEPRGTGTIYSLSFYEVRQRAHAFAGYLQQHVQVGDRVMIWSASRIDWMIAYLGALYAGLVVVPLDVNSREDFLQKIVETTGASFLITSRKQYESLKHPSIPLLDLDALPEAIFQELPRLDEEALAQLVFTSGTTGQPKGVMLSHKNIVSNACAALQVVDVRASDRLLSILPLSHMFELTIEIAALAAGASILYARSLSPETLLKLFATQHATCMVLVPQALQLFLNGIEREVRRQKRERVWELLHRLAPHLPFVLRRRLFRQVHTRFGGHFRFFVSGGAYLSPKLGQRWENMGFLVIQGYGATECAPVVSVTPMTSHNLASIGKPIPGVEVRIAADKELLVQGPNVAPGYWQNPEATALAFRDGWYSTGDLGEIDEQGFLYLKGRKKNMIVLANGLNVYPEDIENILTSIPGVKDAVIIGLVEPDQDPQVHGILLLEDPTKAKPIVQQLNKQLAPHQQVKGYTVWPHEDFPRTHTLKVKRQEVLSELPAIREVQRTASE
jgi:long-chain acyl-CoA synthetase